jgi:tetratricopeptide (TPR) repeat protein
MLSLTAEDLQRNNSILNRPGQHEQLNMASAYIHAGYKFVWDEQSYEEAVEVLRKALQIQQSNLGKHHKDVGYTCSFIGTAFWLKGEHRQAMRYFLEARRIFCKSGQGKVKGVDQRIHCVLEQLGLDSEQIAWYEESIQRTIEHELQGDRLKQNGLAEQAKVEYQKARRFSSSLHSLMNREI